MEDHHVAILLEEIRSQFRVFGEKLDSLDQKIEQGLQDVKKEIAEFKLENRNEHMQLRQAVKELDNEVQDVKLKRIK
jgi:hypothetical protein